jgi:hypothetical protein
LKSEKSRLFLTVSQEEAKRRVATQIEKAKSVPNASVNENDEARRWYEFTAELLRQIFSTEEIRNEFTGAGSYFGDDDISTGHYLKRLISIHERLELYPESGTPNLSARPNPLASIEKLLTKFHSVARQIRQRHDDRPTLDIDDEYDVQDLLHGLLKIYFDDIRPEEWTPSYAGGCTRMDFLLKAEKIVVEVKKTRSKLGAKEIGSQLADDIFRYRSHPDCKTLVCFVYDPEERILNPKGLEHDLSQPVGELQVKVYVTQK